MWFQHTPCPKTMRTDIGTFPSAMGLSLCAWLAGSVERSVCMLAGACEGPARSAFWKTRISLPDVVEALQGSQCLNNRFRRIVPKLLNKVQQCSESHFCFRIMEYFLILLSVLRTTLLHRHLFTSAAFPRSQGLQTPIFIALKHRSEFLLKESI
jgi:hypothetical protein